MDRDQAKDMVKRMEPTFLRRAKSSGWICPDPGCGNGSGSDGDGINRIPHTDPPRYKCHKCGKNYDIISLWQTQWQLDDMGEVFRSLYSYYGIQVDEPERKGSGTAAGYQNQSRTERNTHTDMSIHTNTDAHSAATTAPQQPQRDLTSYFRECASRIGETSYLRDRGISDEMVKKLGIGYDPHFTRGTGGKVWEAVIIPTGKDSFVARNTDPGASSKERYRKSGSNEVFNAQALWNAQEPIIICEGEIDAITILQEGGEAVGLGSAENWQKLMLLLQGKTPKQPLVLALDNDENGQKTTEKLEEELQKLSVPFYSMNLYGTAKDANEAFLKDAEAFRRAVYLAEHKEEEDYKGTSAGAHMNEFMGRIFESADTPCIPTGFGALDKVLDDGLYEGLYICGGISSLGKTSLIMQIADQIAEQGNDVLVFSLEMARNELMSKSISRHTILKVLRDGGDVRNAKTARGITRGSKYETYSEAEIDLIKDAMEEYLKYASHVFIQEGVGDIGTKQIRETLEKHIRILKRKPVLVVDYIQILAPNNERATDKQNMDRAVVELKRISRDFKIPVIGISSLNRQNYNQPISMEALKESGGLEYGADVIFGLQLKGAGGANFDVNEAKQKNPREIELVILKNRNGATGKKVVFDYYPMFNYFSEV